MILFKNIMDTEIKNEENICPYRSEDTSHTRVFNYGGSKLYCDNIECSNLDQSKDFYVEGEGMPVGVCKANGLVDEKSELIKKIKESEFFKTLKAEKLEESRKNREEAIRDKLYSD